MNEWLIVCLIACLLACLLAWLKSWWSWWSSKSIQVPPSCSTSLQHDLGDRWAKGGLQWHCWSGVGRSGIHARFKERLKKCMQIDGVGRNRLPSSPPGSILLWWSWILQENSWPWPGFCSTCCIRKRCVPNYCNFTVYNTKPTPTNNTCITSIGVLD